MDYRQRLQQRGQHAFDRYRRRTPIPSSTSATARHLLSSPKIVMFWNDFAGKYSLGHIISTDVHGADVSTIADYDSMMVFTNQHCEAISGVLQAMMRNMESSVHHYTRWYAYECLYMQIAWGESLAWVQLQQAPDVLEVLNQRDSLKTFRNHSDFGCSQMSSLRENVEAPSDEYSYQRAANERHEGMHVATQDNAPSSVVQKVLPETPLESQHLLEDSCSPVFVFLRAIKSFPAFGKGYMAASKDDALVATHIQAQWYYGHSFPNPNSSGWFKMSHACVLEPTRDVQDDTQKSFSKSHNQEDCIEVRLLFVAFADINSLADGYLCANQDDPIAATHEQGDWYYGFVATTPHARGWFRKKHVVFYEASKAASRRTLANHTSPTVWAESVETMCKTN